MSAAQDTIAAACWLASQGSGKACAVPRLDGGHICLRPVRIARGGEAEHRALRIGEAAHKRLELPRAMLQDARLRPLVPGTRGTITRAGQGVK
jgi:hypothetical protein